VPFLFVAFTDLLFMNGSVGCDTHYPSSNTRSNAKVIRFGIGKALIVAVIVVDGNVLFGSSSIIFGSIRGKGKVQYKTVR